MLLLYNKRTKKSFVQHYLILQLCKIIIQIQQIPKFYIDKLFTHPITKFVQEIPTHKPNYLKNFE